MLDGRYGSRRDNDGELLPGQDEVKTKNMYSTVLFYLFQPESRWSFSQSEGTKKRFPYAGRAGQGRLVPNQRTPKPCQETAGLVKAGPGPAQDAQFSFFFYGETLTIADLAARFA